MRFGSVCSGIEAASVAWKPLGWEPAFYSEIEPFACSVLRHHHAQVPNLGDMTRYKEWPRERIDLLVGGTPCQSFSVAGLRKGLADPRGNLALVYLGVVDALRPRWVVWENVPGVLSSSGGRDLGSFLGALGQLGYGWAYRVLDAQYFGVPQRRRRVFLVGHSGGWQRAAAVLFERESLRGDPAPGRPQGEGPTGTLASRPAGSGGLGTDFDLAGGVQVAPTVTGGPPYSRTGNERVEADALVAFGGNNTQGPIDVATAVRAKGGTGHGDFESETFLAFRKSKRAQSDQDDESWVADGKANTLNQFDEGDVRTTHAIAFLNSGGKSRGGMSQPGVPPVTGSKGDPGNVAVPGMAVRRLTPRECERLQGFPDDYTLIPMAKRNRKAEQKELSRYAKKTLQSDIKWSADGPRYKALGNSMAVPCMKWIGERIQQVEALGEHGKPPGAER